ncbi:MAG: hypothetical protein ACFFB7_08880 [Candidatus Sifarchaeia archaeon]
MKEEEREKESGEGLKRDFTARFYELVMAPIDPSTIYETGESITLVWKTNWVAISLVRKLTFPISLSIQAEISMPVPTDDDDSINYAALPDVVILHMGYLRTLIDGGFDVQVIGEECLWVASKDFKEIPSPEILDMLMPPGPSGQSS